MKKSLLILLVVVFVMAFTVACSTTPTPPAQSDTASAAPSQASAAVSSAAPEQSPAAASPAAATKKKVAFVINCTTSQYSGGYYKAIGEIAKGIPDIDFKIYDGQENATLQAQQVDEAIANNVDLLMLWPQDSKALVAAAKKAYDAKIPVLVCNNNLDKSGEDYIVGFVGPDYYKQGGIAADIMHQALPQGGKYVHLGCDPSYEAARLRLSGFQDQIKAKGYNLEMLGEVAKCDWKLELGKSNMTAFLSKFSGQIDAVYAVDDTIGNGAYQAWQEDKSGKNDRIKFVSLGGISAIFDYLKAKGNYFGTVYQSPKIESKLAMDVAMKILKGEMPTEKFIAMDTPIITQDNVDQYEPAN